MAQQAPRFSIICVCTGNVCRSPAAERLLVHRLGPSVSVRSAGTHALVGQPISPPMDRLVEGAGADPRGFAARRLTETLLEPADLVLTMTRAHRSDVVELRPSVVRRTFTLRELARLITEVPPASLPDGEVPERLRAAIPLAASRRRHVVDARADDVVDPYRQPTDVYAEAFEDIRRAVEAIATVVGPSRASSRR